MSAHMFTAGMYEVAISVKKTVVMNTELPKGKLIYTIDAESPEEAAFTAFILWGMGRMVELDKLADFIDVEVAGHGKMKLVQTIESRKSRRHEY